MLKKTLALTALILPLNATAAIVPINWIGVVSSTTIAGTVDIGDTITGHFSYDDSSSYGSYSDAVTQQYDTNHDSSFSVNGLSGTIGGNDIWVYNNHYSVGDQFDSRGFNGGYTGDLLAGQSVSQIFVRFNDSTASVFADTSLLSELDSAQFNFSHNSRLDLDSGSVGFYVTSFSSVTEVPVPAAGWLFGSAVIGLLHTQIARRERVRSAKH